MFGKKKYKKADEMVSDDIEEDEEEIEPDRKLKEIEEEKEKLKKQIEELQNRRTPEQVEITKVVKEIPVQPIRRYKDEDGTIVNLITIEEALTKLIE